MEVWKAHTEVWEGQEAHLQIQAGLGGPASGLGGLGDSPGGPESPPRGLAREVLGGPAGGLGGVVRHSRRAGRRRDVVPQVL